jgi:hypothetical protein
MKIALSVTTTDGVRTSVAEFADFVKYEEIHNVSMAKIEDDLKVRDLAWLAWHSEKRRNVTSLEFHAWTETVEAISISTEEAKIGPLERTQPTG